MDPDDARAAALASLTCLLDGAHRATPDQLAEVLTRSGRPFGWDVRAYLVTFDQRQMVPLRRLGDGQPDSLDVDDGGASLAFRGTQTVHATDGHTWVALLDGVERLGVLRVTPGAGSADPADHPDLLRWLALVTGHLVAVMTPYGDTITRLRGGSERTVEAELLWNLLPPLTYASENVVISGLLEPSERVAGDAFDYAVEGSRVDLAIFDGSGHDLSSGLLASVALATYRNERRRGADLAACARAIDQMLLAQTAASGFATGVLARLDSTTGVLHYLNAGHPHPLLLRNGRVLPNLDHSGRPLFGLGESEVSLGQVQLEPGDQVLLYTDGITEARDTTGAFFGVERLAALLEEFAAEDVPAPETLRLVVRSVLEHQQGVLQDDATVVLLQWSSAASTQLDPA